MASESKVVPDVCGPVHGQGGVYNAGEWVPIEECDQLLRDPSGRDFQCGNCADCPNKRAPDEDPDKYDVVVIGAGCIGAGVVRELSKYNLRIALVEKSDDVTQGATKGNSGIVHAGCVRVRAYPVPITPSGCPTASKHSPHPPTVLLRCCSVLWRPPGLCV